MTPTQVEKIRQLIPRLESRRWPDEGKELENFLIALPEELKSVQLKNELLEKEIELVLIDLGRIRDENPINKGVSKSVMFGFCKQRIRNFLIDYVI